MAEKQKINCTVNTCCYHNGEEDKCVLKAITVTPMENVETKNPDESMCASYKFEK